MNVGELIAALQKHPAHLPVVAEDVNIRRDDYEVLVVAEGTETLPAGELRDVVYLRGWE